MVHSEGEGERGKGGGERGRGKGEGKGEGGGRKGKERLQQRLTHIGYLFTNVNCQQTTNQRLAEKCALFCMTVFMWDEY